MWPLYSGSTRIMQCFLADMIMTAQQMKVKNGLGSSLPVLLAPATADTTSSTPARVPYSTFTDDLLNTLQGYNFHPGIWYGWSHHNYNDIELDQGSNSSTGRNTMYVADVRNRITSRSGWNGWAGWPTGRATDSAIVLTEGAARREVLYNTYWYDECYVAGHCEGTDEVGTWDWMNDKQARLLEKNWARLQNDGEGARVAMLSWYLFTSTVGGDSGLRDYDPPPWFQGYVDGDTQARPAYWKWQSFPTNY